MRESCHGTYTVGVNIKMVLSANDEEVASSKKNIPNSRLECTNHTLFKTKMVETDTLFQTKRAKKTIPFGAAHTYIAYIRDYPRAEKSIEDYEPRCLRKNIFCTKEKFLSVYQFISSSLLL